MITQIISDTKGIIVTYIGNGDGLSKIGLGDTVVIGKCKYKIKDIEWNIKDRSIKGSCYAEIESRILRTF